MSINVFRNVSLSGFNGSYSTNDTLTAGSKVSVNETVTDGTTDGAVAFAFANAAASDAVMALAIKSSKDATVKIAQSDGTVLDTITLTANVPYTWSDGSGASAPAWRNAGDAAELLVTNSSGEDANLYADVLFDPTP